MPKLGQLGKLSNAERLLIDRRRRGEIQSEAAFRWGVSHDYYSKWERGLREAPLQKVKDLQAYEICFLYRKRSGFTQQHVANKIGCCKEWVKQMEKGISACDELVWFWEA